MQDNISLAVIIKNSEDVIDMFFKWAKDNFSEINVVVDTKNDDMTLAKCLTWEENCNAINVVEYKFDNFSAQWNRAIEMSTKKFCIYMGADEIMEEMPHNGIENFMNASKVDVGVLDRYNLQRDEDHYNIKGFPDRQFRIIRMSSGIKMDGKVVDETLGMTKETKIGILPWGIIHYGHIRPKSALLLKGKDRKVFAKDDNADGKGLGEHGDSWFIYRNLEWDKGPYLKEVPLTVMVQNRLYWDNEEN